MTRGGPESVQRERVVSAAAFALVAAVFDIVGIALTAGFTGLIRDGLSVLLLSPLVLALPAAVVGALAGPRLARASESLEAAVIGIAVTVASALLYVAIGGAILFGMEAVSGNWTMGHQLSDVATAFFFAGVYALVAGLIASPFGALGAVVAWRQIRRSAPAEPS